MIKRIVVKAMVIVMWISLVSSEVYACPTITGVPTSFRNHLVYEPVNYNGNIVIKPLENQRITGWSVDWGDGSKVTKGTGLVIDVTKKDGYSKVGDYTIVITVNWEYYDKKAKVWKPGDPDAVIGNKSASVRIEAEMKALEPLQIEGAITFTLKEPLKVKIYGYKEEGYPDYSVDFSIISYPTDAKGMKLKPEVDRTDSNGIAETKFTVGDKEGLYKIEAKAQNGDKYIRGSYVFTFEINAHAGGFRGRVIDKKTKVSIYNAEVYASIRVTFVGTYRSSKENTDTDGRYHLIVVPYSGTWDLWGSKAGEYYPCISPVNVTVPTTLYWTVTVPDIELSPLPAKKKNKKEI
jgi:hypothetical protein